MTDLIKSRRAVALRIAEAIDAEWPNLNMEGFDVDEATDIVETLIPMTAAEAEAEMEALRDDFDDDPKTVPVENPTLREFKDSVGCGKVPIIDAIKTATELIHSLRASRTLPNSVKQTTPTNCFRACVATVLGLPINEVPQGCDGATWDWDAFQDWLATRGMQAIEVTFENGGTLYNTRTAVPCILTGPSPRNCASGRHAVVGEFEGYSFNLLHDPHESNQWIDGEPTHAVFFVRTDQ